MNVFILGSGGRESSLYWKLSCSDYISNLYFLPGNAICETPKDLQSINILDFATIAKKSIEYSIDVLIVGSEEPLALGIKDFFSKEKTTQHIIVIGPNQYQAQIESSKVFSFEFMKKNDIPQAKGEYFQSHQEAVSFIDNHITGKYVIKADGLLAGKGVSIHNTKESGKEDLHRIFHKKDTIDAWNKVLVQEFMHGEEASLFALCNGEEAIYFPLARDYKRVFDNNLGENTGGMGSYAPSYALTEKQLDYVHSNITKKVIGKLKYRGLLYLGLMVHSSNNNDVSIVEFNCRFGDPEIQSILPLLEEDLFPYLLWTENKEKDMLLPRYLKGNLFYIPCVNQNSINVVIAAKGYPKEYAKGLEIVLPQKIPPNFYLFFAGLKKVDDAYISTGGRILNIVHTSSSHEKARRNAYSFIEETIMPMQKKEVQKQLHYRLDIGI